MFSGLQLPVELPLSIPSKPVRQRPDVGQVKESMHSAKRPGWHRSGQQAANALKAAALAKDARTCSGLFLVIF
jgi:hypothetical protein